MTGHAVEIRRRRTLFDPGQPVEAWRYYAYCRTCRVELGAPDEREQTATVTGFRHALHHDEGGPR